jgi:hypothetical protein
VNNTNINKMSKIREAVTGVTSVGETCETCVWTLKPKDYKQSQTTTKQAVNGAANARIDNVGRGLVFNHERHKVGNGCAGVRAASGRTHQPAAQLVTSCHQQSLPDYSALPRLQKGLSRRNGRADARLEAVCPHGA